MIVWGRRAVSRLTSPARWRFTPAAVVLAYHRVAAPDFDPQLLAVTPGHFAEHLEVLRRESRVIGLADLSRALQRGHVPRGAVVITFDDGYGDNLQHARSALAAYGTPATVFATSGNIASGAAFWWDQLDSWLLRPGRLPDQLRLRLHGRWYEWHLGECSAYFVTDYERNRAWNVLRQDDPTARHSLYRDLHRLLRRLPPATRASVMAQLAAWAGANDAADLTGRPMSPEELAALSTPGLVEIGSHTVNHPVLSALPLEGQSAEIQASKKAIEEIIGRRVSSFSYPFGGRQDYTQSTISFVRNTGHGIACSNFPGLVDRHTDRYQVPRLLVRDWDGDEFAHRLRAWFRHADTL